MPAFKSLELITDHAKYKAELKVALKTAALKKFHYFKNSKVTPGRKHLVVIDCDPDVLESLGPPSASGRCEITDEKQIVFNALKGKEKFRVRLLKKYVETFYKDRHIFVPLNEPEDEEEGSDESAGAADTSAPSAQTGPGAAPPTATVPGQSTPQAPPATSTQPGQPAPQPTPAPATSTGDEATQKFMARFKALQPQILKAVEAKNPKAEEIRQRAREAGELAKKRDFQQANGILDRVEEWLKKSPPTGTPVPSPAAPTSPKLSTYLGATKRWKEAKAAAANGVFALKTAILQECDPELKKAVEAKINDLNGILSVLDDSIVTRIQEAGNEADEERQTQRNQDIVKSAVAILEALRKHPLAEVTDKNPFGSFAIRGPVEAELNRIVAEFGG